MAAITRTQLFSTDARTAFQEYVAYAIVTLNCIQDGNWQRADGRRPHYGRTPGLVGKVVFSKPTARWYAVAAENTHAVICHPVIALWGRWEVVTGQSVTFAKSQIIVQ